MTEGQSHQASCFTEYDHLKSVILCEPEHMTIKDVINETQKKFKNEGIHIEKAMEQHGKFVEALKEQGIEVILLPSARQFPEQVFTRDIGFTLGESVFVAELATDIRSGEESFLENWLQREKLPFQKLKGDEIEGGDVIIDGNTIYAGISNRTSEEAIQHLKTLMPDFEVRPIPFTDTFLHLDCVFNIISPTEALIYPGEIHNESLEYIKSRYDLIEVSKEEQFTLGTNVLSIGDKRLFSLPINKNVNSEMRKRGYEVIEVDITEIIKSGGAFRCCTMPLHRTK
ncbi:dimethylarginine dimethylaminohydrolase family protein [Mesobacillus harenae]|uniref:dimethylarginine dimethylaminohydrolase family protein n=1 Tax=Mesobacillus harenae TaxID=2213203 RepID=UPI0015801084|nr:dimethylarginine dimethylaminohydrolase family protein [Mesobacillus harenae]